MEAKKRAASRESGPERLKRLGLAAIPKDEAGGATRRLRQPEAPLRSHISPCAEATSSKAKSQFILRDCKLKTSLKRPEPRRELSLRAGMKQTIDAFQFRMR